MSNFSKSCIYQIYPISFCDTDGNGTGDIPGIISKLDYLAALGVDYIWSTPFFVSPKNDNGYDIADYCNIDPAYGTMEDFELLIKEAKKRNIYIMLDMVFNHTSTKHQWFKRAMAGDEKYKNFYIFKDPAKDGGPPTNWVSKFGGSTWQYVPKFKQYYLHLYDKTQADLNWENPQVREEIYDVVRFWKDKGVKGFRFDVINLISKPDKYEDDLEGDGRRFYTDGPKIHQYLKEMNEQCGLGDDHIVTVGEMSSTSLKECIRYSNPQEKELSMCFGFHHLKVDYKNQNKWELQKPDFQSLKDILHSWQIGMEAGGGWNAVFWCNHDQPRIVSRFGDEGIYHKESAKMLAGVIHLMRGTPYIYQGEEIGMTNAGFKHISQYRDVESINYYHILKDQGMDEDKIYEILSTRSRDNSRTPMQWSTERNAGFTEGEPWIGINPNYQQINVSDNLADEDSIFCFYQRLVRMRKEMAVVSDGSYYPYLEKHPKLLAYQRVWNDERMIVLANFFGEEVQITCDQLEMNSYQCILCNYDNRELKKEMVFRPYELAVFYAGSRA